MVLMYNKRTEDSQAKRIEIRPTRPADMDELRRVAQRDSRPVPDGELLVATAEGEIRAAISLSAGEVIADPFHHTEEMVRMLVQRHAQMAHRGAPSRGLRRLRLASS
jgi:hypothetical protein